MSASKAVAGTVIVFSAFLGLQALAAQAPQQPEQTTPAAPAAERGATPPAAPTGRGGRGGRGNPMATLFTTVCAGCHGTGMTGGRAPSLFDDQWIRGGDDESIARSIAQGVPNTEMRAFSELNEQQIWQLVYYIRTQAANLKERPQYVADPDGQVIESEKQKFKIEVVARDLETPWGLAFLPDGRLLITERPGRMKIVGKDGKSVAVTGLPQVHERQDGGLFDVEVHPQYARNGWIYLSYAEPGPAKPPATATAAASPASPDAAPAPRSEPGAREGAPAAPAPAAPTAGTPAAGAPTAGAPGVGAPAASAPQRGGGPGQPNGPTGTSMTVIVRGKINKNNEWVNQQVIFRAPPEFYTASNIHYGSRFTFDRQGHLFFTLGERGQMMDAQDLSKPTGKIHRVNADGSVPKDNPFVNRARALPTIWSYGHRNPQGLAWDPVTGKLWESEHGPQGGDEINIIEPGHNYGWGVITMGVQNGITKRAQEGMEQPIVYYTPTIAPSGMTFYAGSRYPAWKNNLFVSALAGQQLRRLEISGDKVTHQEPVFNQFGRVHDVIVGPDGLLYTTLQLPGQVLSASTPGMVVRLVPVQ